MYSTGLTTFSELQSAQGRLDTICEGQSAVYIFEFKIDANAETALKQIHEQNYAQSFLLKNKNIYLVGVNFVTAEKKINGIVVEKWQEGKFVRLTETFTP